MSIGNCVTGLWRLNVLSPDTIDIVPMTGAELGADILAAVAARNEQKKKRRLIDLQELINAIISPRNVFKSATLELQMACKTI
jgi:hypothetical protein